MCLFSYLWISKVRDPLQGVQIKLEPLRCGNCKTKSIRGPKNDRTSNIVWLKFCNLASSRFGQSSSSSILENHRVSQRERATIQLNDSCNSFRIAIIQASIIYGTHLQHIREPRSKRSLRSCYNQNTVLGFYIIFQISCCSVNLTR